MLDRIIDIYQWLTPISISICIGVMCIYIYVYDFLIYSCIIIYQWINDGFNEVYLQFLCTMYINEILGTGNSLKSQSPSEKKLLA